MDELPEKWFDNYEDLFASEGWKQLLSELKENAEHINSVEAAKDEKDLFFRKGQLAVIAQITNLQSQVEMMQVEHDAAI